MIPVMSFWPSVFLKIKNQEKLLEYRRVFPENCTYAYMYISKPVKAISAIIYFKKMHSLEEWEKLYSSNEEVLDRIHTFSSSYRYAMEIEKIQKIEPISLGELRNNVPNFTAPQSYILLENNKVLYEFLRDNTKVIGSPIINDLSNIFPKHICRRY
ncbi:hypothetical protein [Staphylococcus xylosus]|uniref:hypothetical protein n=1 Tax=Staphylococcus xylosus TaxID=1288 RepID=UPI003F54EF9D